jgi:hypothetical protein
MLVSWSMLKPVGNKNEINSLDISIDTAMWLPSY